MEYRQFSFHVVEGENHVERLDLLGFYAMEVGGHREESK
jgi:hypothetical protein